MATSANQPRSAFGIGCLFAACTAAEPAPPAFLPPPLPPLTLDAAVRMALERNPEIAAVRQAHGIAAAGVVVPRAYPFNPVWEGRARYAWPVSEGATNAYPVESTVLLELEVRGQ